MKPYALINNIVVPTDFSSCAERAYDHALTLAGAYGATLHFLHVLEFQPGMDPEYPVNRMYLDELRKNTAAQLDQLVLRTQHQGVRTTQQQAMGVPSQEIIAAARRLDADLVVLGTHGRTGLTHVLLGSTAERVVSGGPCPVLVVRERESHASPAIGRILAPIDFSDCSLEALEYAAQIAHRFSASLSILHVMEPESYGLDFTLRSAADPGRVERLRERLAALTSALAGSGLTVEHVLQGGFPADAILNREREQSIDLIVMGTHGRRGLSHLASGSVAESVLRRSRCPVLTVRSPKFAPGHRRLVPLTPIL